MTELIVAIAILSLVSLLVFQYQWGIKRLNADLVIRLRVINKASEMLEKVLEAKKLPHFLHRENDGVFLAAKPERFQLDQVNFSKLGLHLCKQPENFYIITVVARWKDLSGVERTFKIMTGAELEKK